MFSDSQIRDSTEEVMKKQKWVFLFLVFSFVNSGLINVNLSLIN